ncbi:MAG: hypothetical protein AB7T06_10930 [Kofleriaceae bacterium]
MANRDRNGRAIVLVGGAALAAWWLLSLGGGWGSGSPGTGRGGDVTVALPERCVVWIRADRLEIDGVAADLATVIARCRLVGSAEVHATGDAVTRVVREVLTALHAAGVAIYAKPDLAYIVPAEVIR